MCGVVPCDVRNVEVESSPPGSQTVDVREVIRDRDRCRKNIKEEVPISVMKLDKVFGISLNRVSLPSSFEVKPSLKPLS